MKQIMKIGLFALTALFMSFVALKAHVESGDQLYIKNDSALPITVELRTTIMDYGSHLYKDERVPSEDGSVYIHKQPSYTSEVHKKIVIQPNEAAPTHVNIPNSHPIIISLSVDNRKIISDYIIEADGFNDSVTEAVTMPISHSEYSYLKAKMWWSSHTRIPGPFDPSYPVYLNIEASYANSRYFWW